MILAGIHPVAEALRAGRPLERVLVAKGAGGPRLQEIIELARASAIPLRFEPRPALDRLAGTAAVVMGGEGKGIHEMVRKRCDAIVRIPMTGKISSLNVSVAAGIVLFDWKRRKGGLRCDGGKVEP